MTALVKRCEMCGGDNEFKDDRIITFKPSCGVLFERQICWVCFCKLTNCANNCIDKTKFLPGKVYVYFLGSDVEFCYMRYNANIRRNTVKQQLEKIFGTDSEIYKAWENSKDTLIKSKPSGGHWICDKCGSDIPNAGTELNPECKCQCSLANGETICKQCGKIIPKDEMKQWSGTKEKPEVLCFSCYTHNSTHGVCPICHKEYHKVDMELFGALECCKPCIAKMKSENTVPCIYCGTNERVLDMQCCMECASKHGVLWTCPKCGQRLNVAHYTDFRGEVMCSFCKREIEAAEKKKICPHCIDTETACCIDENETYWHDYHCDICQEEFKSMPNTLPFTINGINRPWLCHKCHEAMKPFVVLSKVLNEKGYIFPNYRIEVVI